MQHSSYCRLNPRSSISVFTAKVLVGHFRYPVPEPCHVWQWRILVFTVSNLGAYFWRGRDRGADQRADLGHTFAHVDAARQRLRTRLNLGRAAGRGRRVAVGVDRERASDGGEYGEGVFGDDDTDIPQLRLDLGSRVPFFGIWTCI